MSETLTTKELDIAIGEQIMGWKRVWVRGWHGYAFLGGHYASSEECWRACAEQGDPELRPIMLWSKDGTTWGAGEEWSPSTTWEGAGLVVERLLPRWPEATFGEDGPHFALECDPQTGVWTAGWKYAVFYEGDFWDLDRHAIGKTGPDAICNWALKVAAALAATETGG